MKTKRVIVSTGAVAVVAAAAIGGWIVAGDHRQDPAAAASAAKATAEPVAVTKGDLTTESDFTGTVSFGDSWSLPLPPGGIVTANRPAGTVVDFGEVLVAVDNRAVYLARGGLPMYRDLSLQPTHLKGYDVGELQQFLIAQGFDEEGDLTVDGEYDTTTRDAVKAWQESVGLPATGRIDRSQLVFSPTALRIDHVSRVGTSFDGLTVTDATSVITVEATDDNKDDLPVGGDVAVELADGSTRTGTVASQEREVHQDGSTSWTTAIDVTGGVPADETTVIVHRTVVEAADVLIVPVAALLAVANGGFAVEVVDGAATHLVPVKVGTVVEARAEVTGDLKAGDRVVIPA